MSRNLLPSAITYLENTTNVKIAHLIKIELAESTEGSPVYMYVTDYANNITWAGNPYEAGKVTKVGHLRQTQGLTNYKLSVDIAGEFQEELDRGLVDHNNKSYVGRTVEVLRAYLDEAANIIPFDKTTNGPMQYFIGDISSINISEQVISGESSVTWECAGKFQDFELINGRMTDDAAHRGLVASNGTHIPSDGAKKVAYQTDRGFQHANQTIEVVTQYTTMETRYRTKSSWLGFRTKTIEYQEEVYNTLELGVSLAAKALPKVYGVRKVPGIPIFIDTLKDASALYVVYAFCEGEVDSILNFYMDGAPLICSSSEDADHRVCLGNQANGDTLSAYSTLSAQNEIDRIDAQFSQFFIHKNPEGIYNEGMIPLIPPSDPARTRTTGTKHAENFTITGDAGRRWIKVFHGKSGQEACAELVSKAANNEFALQDKWAIKEFGAAAAAANRSKYWDAECTLEDTCYAVLKIGVTEDTKIPELEAVISGQLVDTYDSNLTKSVQPEYTLNPVWHTLNYMTDPISGGGLDPALVDIKSFQAVAAALDTVSTTYGDDYATYWRYIGWRDAPGTNTVNIEGVEHDVQKAKMQTNTVVRTENTVTKNLQGMLAQFDATINILGSKYHLSIEDNNTPIANITADEVIGSIKTKDLSNKNKWNSVQATIVNPAQGWGTTQINFFNSEYLAADNGIAKKGNISFNNITNYYTAREWAQIQLSKSRYSREITFTTYYKYSYLYPNANITFTYPRFGYNNKVFRVKTCTLQPDGLVNLTIEDYDESIYSVVDSADVSGETTPIIPKVLPPKGLEFVSLPSARFANLTPENFPGVNGLLLWDVAPENNVLRYDVKDWLGVGTDYGVLPSTTLTDSNNLTKHYIEVTELSAATLYSFKVRSISPRGIASKWTISEVTLPSVTEAQYTAVQNFTATNTYDGQHFDGPDLAVSWDIHSSPNVTKYLLEIYDETATTLLRVEDLPKSTINYTYTLAKNISDYATNNAGAVGAYRGLTMFIRASDAGGTIVSERTELT